MADLVSRFARLGVSRHRLGGNLLAPEQIAR
jgi:hypothetical protein